MKKLWILLAFALLLGFTGCNNEVSEEGSRHISENSFADESTSISEEGSVTIVEQSGYIDFQLKGHRFTHKSDVFSEGIYLIKSHEELVAFYQTAKVTAVNDFGENYFKDKALIVIFQTRGSGSINLILKHLYIENGTLTATVMEQNPEVQTDDMQYRTISAEVAAEDVESVHEIELVLESQFMGSYYSDDKRIENDNIQQHVFGGSLTGEYAYSGAMRGTVVFSWLDIIKDPYELALFTNKYNYNGKGGNLLDFTESIGDEYFEEKFLVAISYKGDYKDTKVELRGAEIHSDGVTFGIYVSEEGASGYEDFSNVILAEIPTGSIENNPQFAAIYDYVEFDYAANEHDIEFSSEVFKGCHDGPHTNIINDVYIPVALILDTEDLEEFTDKMCQCVPTDKEFFDYTAQFDEDFFEENALLIATASLDKGETLELGNVYAHNHLGFGVLKLDIYFEDSVQPSSDENLESYLITAVIDKNETIGYDWIDGDFRVID